MSLQHHTCLITVGFIIVGIFIVTGMQSFSNDVFQGLQMKPREWFADHLNKFEVKRFECAHAFFIHQY